MENTTTKNQVLIDIEKVIGNKNPRLLKLLPRFVINYIKKTIHQEEVNQFLIENEHNDGLDFVAATIKGYNITIESHGFEYIPEKGRYIFASNHPLGGMESMALMHIVGAKFKNLKFLVNDVLMHLKSMQTLFLPINKHGANSRDAAHKIEETYASDNQVLIFPAGLVSRKINGKITDLTWNKHFIQKAVQYQRDVIPVFIDGKNSKFFYNLAQIRKFLGIKANIEMFYLVDELYKQRGNTIRFVFGKPIPYSTFTKEKKPAEWAEEVKRVVYEIGKKHKNRHEGTKAQRHKVLLKKWQSNRVS